MHVGLGGARELVFVLFVNVPTLNKTFDLLDKNLSSKR
jgi:hypothetical protein